MPALRGHRVQANPPVGRGLVAGEHADDVVGSRSEAVDRVTRDGLPEWAEEI